ncbi:hypothetical protein [Reyranella sp.]|uniref:hypothetical protein n=1 Tax=Reyranella sp. TaxID=1929291 RepID=UPI0025EF22B2|nr:hypothetical protein [Reyranella sp.]
MYEYVSRTCNRSKLRAITAAAIAGAVVLGTTGGAMAGNWKKGRGHYYYAPAPVYVAPAPYYYAPPPRVVYAPPPVVVYPAPAAYAPAYPAYPAYGPGGNLSFGINVPLR